VVELACRRIVFRILLVAACLSAAPAGAGAAAQSDKLAPVDPRKVKVGGEIGRRIDITIRNNVLKIDNDAVFLKSFRARNRRSGGYVGFGKHIDALVRLAFHSQDKKLIELKDHLIAELIKTQLPSGYIGIFRGDHMRLLWDLHEASYILFALVSDYEHFGNKASLEAAKKLADYMMKVRPRRPIVVYVTTIGFERAFIALYEATGEKKYLDHVTMNDSLQNWHGGIGGHAYDIVSVCMAQLDMYRLEPDAKLLRQSRKVVDFMLAGDGMGVMGTGSNHERWHSNQASSNKFGETCFTAYWLRLLDRLIQIEGKPIYGDVMERSIYNALFAVQSPGGRELHKYTPFEGRRHYYRGERGSDFQRDAYCCPNNYRRIIAELPNMIYYRSGGGLTVNLYTASSSEIKLSGKLSVGVRQETDYPNSGGVVIHVAPSKAAKFPVSLRIPRWCGKPQAAVNGEAVSPVKPGEFLVIDRTWRKGDRIELKMPMKLRLIKGRKIQKGKVAVMRGPMLFCLNPMRQAKRHPIFGGRRGKQGGKLAKPRATVAEVLRATTLDLTSLEGPVKDATVRPGGLACKVKAWGPGADRKKAPNLELVLTEYADPGGEATYFAVSDPAIRTVDDELFR